MSIGVPGILVEHICFDAQQAVEQAIKAVLVAHRVRFPRVHDIGALFAVAEQQGIAVPGRLAVASTLTRYAVITRYGEGPEPITEEDRAAAIACAEAVLQWAEQMVDGEAEEAAEPRHDPSQA